MSNNHLSYYKNIGNGSLEILDENHYYPFELKQTGYGVPVVSSGYKYKYNGKELQDELGLNWYDFGLRQYDPALGRMLQIDPITHHNQSPYVAFDNNPVFWSDPDGAETVDPIKDPPAGASVSLVNAKLIGKV